MEMLHCPNCGSRDLIYVDPNRLQCSYCGTVFAKTETPVEYVHCPTCGLLNKASNNFCSQCGAPLSIATPSAVGAPTTPQWAVPQPPDNVALLQDNVAPAAPAPAQKRERSWSVDDIRPQTRRRPSAGTVSVPSGLKKDPALGSILVTVIGSAFVPIAAPIVGLVMAYKARREARARGEVSKLSGAAVLIGWLGLAATVFPMLAVALTQFMHAFTVFLQAFLH